MIDPSLELRIGFRCVAECLHCQPCLGFVPEDSFTVRPAVVDVAEAFADNAAHRVLIFARSAVDVSDREIAIGLSVSTQDWHD